MLKSKKNKVITGTVSGVVAIIAIIAIATFAPNNPVDMTEPSDTSGTTATTAPEADELAATTAARRSVATYSIATAAPATATEPPEEADYVDETLAPVYVPDERVRAEVENRDAQVAPPSTTPQTAPPESEQHVPDATTYIDGQLHVWNPVLGWVRSSGDGEVIIMDVESDGEMYEGGWG